MPRSGLSALADFDQHVASRLLRIELRRLAAGGAVDAVMTYDIRLAQGARHHGLEVIEPGQ